MNCQAHLSLGENMQRREFIALLGGAAAWPLAARAQQAERMRRIGVLMAFDENDPEAKACLSAFTQGLAELGWTDGRNLRMDVRWAAGNVDRMRMFAKELVDLQPDVILATLELRRPLHSSGRRGRSRSYLRPSPTRSALASLRACPARAGISPASSTMEAAMAGKWLELLTEIAPGVKRVAIMFNPDTAPGGGSYYPALIRGSRPIAQSGADRSARS